MRRVLVLAYYFPPLGGSGVQRIAKLVKYLPRWGWQPVVLTARPGLYLAHDPTLLDEIEKQGIVVHQTRSLDPTRLGRGTMAAVQPDPGQRKLAKLITGTLFIPDNKRGWMPFALRAGRELMQQEPFDAVLSTAPPYTSHLIAARLGKQAHLPVVLDYRDDWLGNPRHAYPTRGHYWLHRRMEANALQQAACVTTINATIAAAIRARGPAGLRVEVLPQGYDPEDFLVAPAPRDPQIMRFVYTGMFYDAQQPDAFLEALALFVRDFPEARERVEALFAGLVPPQFAARVEALGLGKVVRYIGYLPHRDSVALLRSADVLWLTVGAVAGAAQLSTSKLHEYMGSGLPILGLVPEGEAADALRRYGRSLVVSPVDIESIKQALATLWKRWRQGDSSQAHHAYLAQHDRINLAKKMADLLGDVVESRRPVP